MIDYYDLPRSGGGGYQLFTTPAVTTSDYYVWTKPRNAKMVYFFAVGAGSGAGGGAGGAAGTVRGGGGGGGGGSGIVAICPAFILPEFLYVAPGLGGKGGTAGSSGAGGNGSVATGTFVSAPFAPAYDASSAVIIIQANGATGTVGVGGSSSGGGAGSGSNGSPVTNPTGILGRACLWQSFLCGSNAAAGGTNAGGGAISLGTGFIQAGSGGGGVDASNNVGAGGGITTGSISLAAYLPTVPGAVGAGFGGLGTISGGHCINDSIDIGRLIPWTLTGGGGGGGNAAGAGGNGGNAAPGCGGGGGGGGTTTGGVGGRGGDGFVLITWW